MTTCVCCGFPIRPHHIVTFNHQPIHPGCMERWERSWIFSLHEIRRIRLDSIRVSQEVKSIVESVK